jgi:hypothetical protein
MKATRNRRLGFGCVLTADGKVSAYPLHEQLVEGVDDSDFRAETRRKLLERGLKPEQIDGLFPDLPPSIPSSRGLL